MLRDYPRAIRDICEGIASSDKWGRFGWQEVRRRYRRTALGPFWATLSLGIFVAALGLIWGRIWHQPMRDYLPYLSSGMVAWTLVQSIITESCLSFTQYESIIKNFDFSFTILAATVVWRNIIVFFHNIVVFLIVVAIFQTPIGWEIVLVVPGLMLVAVNGIWMALLLGMVCARFRDIQILIGSVLQIALFVTPIMWSADQLPEKERFLFVYPNVLFHIIDVVRSPLLSHVPQTVSYVGVLIFTLVGWTGTVWIFARFRRRVAYWV